MYIYNGIEIDLISMFVIVNDINSRLVVVCSFLFIWNVLIIRVLLKIIMMVKI